MVRIVWRTSYSGRLPVAPGQGAVIVCNHISPVDPAYIALATKGMVRWMVAREYCENWLLGPPLRALEAIPAGRSGIDTAATREAIRSAHGGRMVGMFPEGRINRTHDFLQPGRPGAVVVALKARVPIIPCFLQGAPYDGTTLGCFFMFGKAHLTVGRPIDLSEYYGREDNKQVQDVLTRRILSAIAELGGRPDFVPQVAGRRWNEKREIRSSEIATPASS
jgi:1-acyl-sn-glycerol-3-phosphate acyltransferase